MEELESDDSKACASVFDTFHGKELRRVVVDHRKRSRGAEPGGEGQPKPGQNDGV